ncbi:MAG TPA: lysophospholipid acyltransferase family protein [Candidatus Limnocylindria bacterium]|nr:lysophospholipid acyltransferase family protein [Candidatus Limnocylindria bacterium]
MLRQPAERPGPLKYNFIRYGLRVLTSCYLRVRVEGTEHLPPASAGPYLINFSHPNWVDPIVLVGFWPDRRWIMIFGPREEDMGVGGRNRIINWARMGVPFKPSKKGLLETARRAVEVTQRGYVLAVAGEGRLSDEEGAIVPLEDGPAYLALRTRVAIVPVAIIGTRWLRFGKRVTLRIGPALDTAGRPATRGNVAQLTDELTRAMERLLEGVVGEPPPGPFGRWLTDVFNERPWLTEAAGSPRSPGPPPS